MHSFLRTLIRTIYRAAARIGLRLDIEGWDNLPPGGPLIVISNHFSIFEAPLLIAFLPYADRMTFLTAIEAQESHIMAVLIKLFNLITIWRGQPDRAALHQALDFLADGGVLGIMPEGSVDEDLREQIAAGHQTGIRGGPSARASARLISARPGAAYLAVRSGAPILPIAFLGSEKILTNLRRGRRTDVRMIIGPVFGPILVDSGWTRTERRQFIDESGHTMMHHLATLLPPENRGPYA